MTNYLSFYLTTSIHITDCCSQADSTPVSYSACHELKPRRGIRLYSTWLSWHFSIPPAKYRKIPHVRAQEFTSTALLIHFSLIVLIFDATDSKLLTVLLNKQHINKYTYNINLLNMIADTIAGRL
jgi:hypothetical protein